MMSILPNESIAVWTSSSARAGLGQVAGEDGGLAVDLAGGLLGDVAVEVVDQDLRSLGDEQLSGRAADPRAEPVTIADFPSSTPMAVVSPCLRWRSGEVIRRRAMEASCAEPEEREMSQEDVEVVRRLYDDGFAVRPAWSSSTLRSRWWSRRRSGRGVRLRDRGGATLHRELREDWRGLASSPRSSSTQATDRSSWSPGSWGPAG